MFEGSPKQKIPGLIGTSDVIQRRARRATIRFPSLPSKSKYLSELSTLAFQTPDPPSSVLSESNNPSLRLLRIWVCSGRVGWVGAVRLLVLLGQYDRLFYVMAICTCTSAHRRSDNPRVCKVERASQLSCSLTTVHNLPPKQGHEYCLIIV